MPRLLRDWLALFNRLDGNDVGETEARDRRNGGLERSIRLRADGGPPKADRRLQPRPRLVHPRRGGNRVAKRGGGGLVTALRSLVAHHDVTWIASAMTDEDRAVAVESGGEAIEEVARDGSPYRLRLVAHDPAAYDWYYNVVANPTLWFLQHYLWALAYAPDIDPGLHHAWDDGLRPGEPRVRGGRADGARGAARRSGLLPRLPPLSRAAVRARRAAGRLPRPLRPHSVAGAESLARPARADPRRDPRRAARERRRRLPRASLAPELPALGSRPARRGLRLRAQRLLVPRRQDVRRGAADLGRPVRVRGARRKRAGAATGGRARVEAAGGSDPARRPHRSRRRTSSAASGRSSSISTRHPEMHGRVGMLALLDPSRQDIPEYAEYLGAIQRGGAGGQRPLPERGLDAGRPADRGQLPVLGRRVQAIRRPARERDLRRAESRRQGGRRWSTSATAC